MCVCVYTRVLLGVKFRDMCKSRESLSLSYSPKMLIISNFHSYCICALKVLKGWWNYSYLETRNLRWGWGGVEAVWCLILTPANEGTTGNGPNMHAL